MDSEILQSTPDAWAPKQEPAHLPTEEFARWKLATAAVRRIAGRDTLTKSEVARRADVPLGTFSPWFDGTYTGKITSITARVERWIAAIEERARVAGDVREPGFVQTRTAAEVIDTLVYAQALPEMCVITLGAGMGKTITARHFADTRPHAVLVTMRPSTAKVYGMMGELCAALGVIEYGPARLDRAIGERLKRNGRHTLLMVDEAQNLDDQAVNQLRYYMDEFGCGIALLGNEELYGRFGGAAPKPAYAQLHRRIGKRLKRLAPLQADIDAIVAAWKLEDAEAANLARAIGRKPGALGQVSKTLILAHMLAAGDSKPLSADHVRLAWQNRGGEELRSSSA
jgi:DNA transposition AAA+ family ATPase